MKLNHWLLFLLLGAIWSSSFMWIKIAIQEIGPIMIVAFRASFGLIFGIVVIVIGKVELPRDWRSWMPLLLIGITNVSIPFFLISWGEQRIDSAVAAILDATVPLFTILIAHILLHDDRISVPKLAGLLLGFGGVAVLVSKDLANSSTSSLVGSAAVILASIFYAISAIYIRITTQDVPGILRSAGPLVSASILMWLGTLVLEQPVIFPQLGLTWLALLWLGIFGSGFAFLIAFYLIHEIGPTRTSLVTYLFPLGGVILGVGLLHEQLSVQLVIGAVLIIVSLAISNIPPANQTVPE
jgi:drug/metabolite transporter (DMT)-like permease